MKLLDKIHTNDEIIINTPVLPINNLPELFNKISALNVFAGWKEDMENLAKEFTGPISRLTPDNIRGIIGDIANKSNVYKNAILSSLASSLQGDIVRTIQDIMSKKLENSNKISWQMFFNILSTYFIIPMNRIKSGYTGKSLNLSEKLIKELSAIHGDQLRDLIQGDMTFFKSGVDGYTPTLIMNNTFAKYKITHFLENASRILDIKNDIRPTMLPGGAIITKYLQSYILYGLLSDLVNSNNIGDSVVPVIGTDLISGKHMMNFIIKSCMYDFLNKYIDISDEHVKYIVQSITEKEKRKEIARIREMTTEQKMADKEQRKLGVGYYGVGSEIWKYNADHFDKEQSKGLHDSHEGSTEFHSFGKDVRNQDMFIGGRGIAIARGTGLYDGIDGNRGAGDGGYDVRDASRADE